jgi:tape measure domain-containing protein
MASNRPIDEKIIKLQLDNRDFQQKVTKSISTFSTFTSKLEGVNTKSLMAIETGIDALNNKFTLTGTIVRHLFDNIANKALSIGSQITKALGLDGVMDGFNEYELKMDSIKTIIANTNAPLKQVSSYLDDLNHYADLTVYSFSDMTRNIGYFTAAGVKLKPAVTAIKGLSNLAASVGANNEAASRAMYQLSQELANGKVTLMGWNSVVNAGMGGKKFQDAIMKTTGQMIIQGKVTKRQALAYKHITEGTKSFRDTLKDGWLTSDILLKTLDRFSKDKSMLKAATQVRTFTQLIDTTKEAIGSAWAGIWENVVGDSQEAPKFFTKVSEKINAIINNTLGRFSTAVQKWHDRGGRQILISGLGDIAKSLVNLASPLKGFYSVFSKGDWSTSLIKGTKSFRQFAREFKMDTANMVSFGTQIGKIFGTIFKTLFKNGLSVINALSKSVKKIGKSLNFKGTISNVLKLLTSTVNKVSSLLIRVANKLPKYVGKVLPYINKADSLIQKLINKLLKYLPTIASIVTDVLGTVIKDLSKVFSSVYKQVGSVLNKININSKAVKSAINQILTALSSVFNIVASGLNYITRNLSGPISKFITKTFKSFKAILVDIFDIARDIVGDFKYLANTIGPVLVKIFKSTVTVVTKLESPFVKVVTIVKDVYDIFRNLVRIAGIVAEVVGSILFPDAFTKSLHLANRIFNSILKTVNKLLDAADIKLKDFNKHLSKVNKNSKGFKILASATKAFKNSLSSVINTLSPITDVLGQLFRIAKEFIGYFGSKAIKVIKKWANIDTPKNLGIIGDIIEKIKNYIKNIDKVPKDINTGLKSMSKTLQGISGETLAKNLINDVKLLNIEIQAFVKYVTGSDGFKGAVTFFQNGLDKIVESAKNFDLKKALGITSETTIDSQDVDYPLKVNYVTNESQKKKSLKKAAGIEEKTTIESQKIDGRKTSAGKGSDNKKASSPLDSLLNLFVTDVHAEDSVSGYNAVIDKIYKSTTKSNKKVKKTVGNTKKNVVNPITDLLSNINPLKTISKTVKDILNNLYNLPSGDLLRTFGPIAAGAFGMYKVLGKLGKINSKKDSPLDPIKEIAGAPFKPFASAAKYLSKGLTLLGIGSILNGVKSFAEGLAIMQNIKITSGMKASISMLVGMMADITTIVYISSKAGKGMGGSMVGLALAVKSIGSLVKTIGIVLATVKTFKSSDFDKAMTLFNKISAFINLTLAISAVAGFAKVKVAGLGVAMLLISTSMLIAVGAIMLFATIDENTFKDGLSKIAIVLAAIGGLTGLISKFAGNNVAKLGIGVLGIAASLLVLYNDIQLFSNMDWDVFATGGEKIAILAVGIAAFTRLVDSKKLVSVGFGIIEVAAAMNILVPAIKSLGGMKGGDAFQGVLAVSAIFVAIGAMGRLLSSLDAKQMTAMTGMIFSLGVSFALVSGGLKLIAKVPIALITTTLLLFDTLILSMGKFAKVAGEDSKTIKAVGVSIIMVSAAFAIMTEGIKILKGSNFKMGTVVLAGFVAIIAELGAIAKMAKKNKISNKTFLTIATSMLILSSSFGVFATSLSGLKGTSLKTTAAAITGFVTIFGELGIIARMAAKNGIESKSFVGIGASMVTISAAFMIFTKGILSLKGTDLKLIAATVGGFAGIMAELGILSKLKIKSETILAIAAAMLVISTAFVIYSKSIESMKDIDVKTIGAITAGFVAITGVISAIAGIAAGMKISSEFSVTLLAMSAAIVAIATAFSIFSTAAVKLKDLDTGSIKTAAIAFVSIGGILTAIGGILGSLPTGLLASAGVAAIGLSLEAIFDAFGRFADALKVLGGVDFEVIEKNKKTMTDTIPAILKASGGGLFGRLINSGSLTSFSKALSTFSKAYARLANAFSNASGIDMSASAADYKSAIKQITSMTGSASGLISVSSELQSASASLTQTAKSFNKASGIKDGVDNVITPLKKLRSFATSSKGLSDDIDKLKSSANSIKALSKSVSAAGKSVAVDSISAINSKWASATKVGFNLCTRLVNGMTSNRSAVLAEARSIASSTAAAINKTLSDKLNNKVYKPHVKPVVDYSSLSGLKQSISDLQVGAGGAVVKNKGTVYNQTIDKLNVTVKVNAKDKSAEEIGDIARKETEKVIKKEVKKYKWR